MTATVRRVDAAHDMTFGRGLRNIARGDEAAVQRVVCDLLVILGEWFLDTDDGVPWVQLETSDVTPILGSKPPDPGYAEALVKQRILRVEGVVRIKSFDITADTAARSLTGQVIVILDDGLEATINLANPLRFLFPGDAASPLPLPTPEPEDPMLGAFLTVDTLDDLIAMDPMTGYITGKTGIYVIGANRLYILLPGQGQMDDRATDATYINLTDGRTLRGM